MNEVVVHMGVTRSCDKDSPCGLIHAPVKGTVSYRHANIGPSSREPVQHNCRGPRIPYERGPGSDDHIMNAETERGKIATGEDGAGSNVDDIHFPAPQSKTVTHLFGEIDGSNALAPARQRNGKPFHTPHVEDRQFRADA